MINKKGFTLLELLVVVLIIGILAGIALPQYRMAVEKTKATEAIMIIKNIMAAEERAFLQYGDGEDFHSPNNWDIEFDEGHWSENKVAYVTNNFIFFVDDGTGVDAYRCVGQCPNNVQSVLENYSYSIWGNNNFIPGNESDLYTCYCDDDYGAKVCKQLSNSGIVNECSL